MTTDTMNLDAKQVQEISHEVAFKIELASMRHAPEEWGLEDALRRIAEMAETGRFKTRLYGRMGNDTAQALRDKGFDVNMKDSLLIKVSWNKIK